MSKPVIAILAEFPISEADPLLPQPTGHYAVWLSALFHALEHQNDFELHWVTLSKGISTPLRFKAKGQHIHILPRARKMIGLYTLYWYDRRMLAKELRKIAPDLVHAWGNEDCYALAGKDFPGRKLLSIQGILRAYMQRGSMARFQRHHSIYEGFATRAYEHITTESPWAAARITELAPGKQIHHLEYAVEEVFRGLQRDLSPAPTVLFAGSDTPIKNLGTLITAFQDPRLSHVTLRLAGIEKRTHPNLPSNIIPLGRLDRQAMAQELRHAWCLAHPSLADTGPTIVKEARVMGVPVVLTTECGSKQHIEEGKSGFIVAPMDIEGYIRAILYITANQERALNMGLYGQEQCCQALSSETMTATLIKLYHFILASSA